VGKTLKDMDTEARSVVTLKFESKDEIEKVEEGLREICPEGTRVTGFVTVREGQTGCDVYRYTVVLLLKMEDRQARRFFGGSKDKEEMVRHEEFKEFCREHVLDMEIDVIVGDNEGKKMLELAEMCRALSWSMEVSQGEGEIRGFGDAWVVRVVLEAAAKMIEKMEVGEDELTEEEEEIWSRVVEDGDGDSGVDGIEERGMKKKKKQVHFDLGKDDTFMMEELEMNGDEG